MRIIKIAALLSAGLLAACAQPGDPEYRLVSDADKRLLQSVDTLRAANKGAVSFGAISHSAGLISIEVPVEIYFQRVDLAGQPRLILGNGWGPYIRVVEPGDYVMASLSYFDGVAPISGPLPPLAPPKEGESHIDFSVKSGEVLNLGQMEIELYDRHGTRYRQRDTPLPPWIAKVTPSGPTVRHQFIDDFPALVAALENRPVACIACSTAFASN